MAQTTKRFRTNKIEKLKVFDRYEGERRTEIKYFDRTIEYRGFEIKRNAYLMPGAEGYWEVPELKYIGLGGIKKGFLTVSIIQSKEAIDKYYDMNMELNTLNS
jgi:hypothetical protein